MSYPNPTPDNPLLLPLKRLSSVAAVAVVADDDLAQPPLAEWFARPGVAALFEVPAGELAALWREPELNGRRKAGIILVIAFADEADAVQFEFEIARARGAVQ